MMRPKESALRSVPYRRLVAGGPCVNCGILGYSQAAHVPPSGRAIKADDRLTFAMCCARPGIVGCHEKFDQFKLMPKRWAVAQGMEWAAETRRRIIDAGQWPKNLPRYKDEI